MSGVVIDAEGWCLKLMRVPVAKCVVVTSCDVCCTSKLYVHVQSSKREPVPSRISVVCLMFSKVGHIFSENIENN